MESCSRKGSVLQVWQENSPCLLNSGNTLVRGIFGVFYESSLGSL